MPIKNSPKCGANLLSPLSSLLFLLPFPIPATANPQTETSSLSPLSTANPQTETSSLSPLSTANDALFSPAPFPRNLLFPLFSLLPLSPREQPPPSQTTPSLIQPTHPQSNHPFLHPTAAPLPTWTTHLPSLSPIRLFLLYSTTSLTSPQTHSKPTNRDILSTARTPSAPLSLFPPENSSLLSPPRNLLFPLSLLHNLSHFSTASLLTSFLTARLSLSSLTPAYSPLIRFSHSLHSKTATRLSSPSQPNPASSYRTYSPLTDSSLLSSQHSRLLPSLPSLHSKILFPLSLPLSHLSLSSYSTQQPASPTTKQKKKRTKLFHSLSYSLQHSNHQSNSSPPSADSRLLGSLPPNER